MQSMGRSDNFHTKHHPQQHRQYHPRHQQETFSETQFPVHPLHRFKVKCATFRQPIEIGSFSYNEQREFVMDDSQLKYYFPPDLTKPNNLSVNYDKYISRDLMVDEHIDALLDALICIRDSAQKEQRQRKQQQDQGQDQGQELSEQKEQEQSASVTHADFICYRGQLTKIMCTPYNKNESWEMNATLYKGSIYIEENFSAERREQAAGTNDRHKLMSYWGYRFETICNISKPLSELQRIITKKRPGLDLSVSGQSPRAKATKLEDSDKPSQPSKEPTEERDVVEDTLATMTNEIDLNDPELISRLDGIVNTNIQYCTVARTKIGKNSIIMGAEVDCTSEPKRGPSHNSLSNYIELKTSRMISNARERSNFERHKLLKIWAQSFLPGIPTIIIGFRDDDGNVVTVETFRTMEIPRLVRGKEGAWDSTVCINFLDSVLNFLRKQITIDDPEVTYLIRWSPPFQAIEIECKGKGTSFLTERYLNSIRNIKP
ncbi:Dom-3 Z [Linnemannia zychae]|nr:Dom-3 Z [Linnemannia zychae]